MDSNKQLILYRRHSSNASNNKENTMDKRLVSIKEQIKSIDYLLNKSKDIRIKTDLSRAGLFACAVFALF